MRNHHPHRHLHRVQHKHAEIEQPLTRIAQHLPHRLATGDRRSILFRQRNAPNQANRDQRQRSDQQKNPVHTDAVEQQRPEHQRTGKRQRNAHADHRHRARAHRVARGIGDHRHHHAGNRTGALQRPRRRQTINRLRRRCPNAARRKNQQAEGNHRFSAKPIRGQTVGNVQKRLRQAIRAHRQANRHTHFFGCTHRAAAQRQGQRIRRQHRQHDKQPKHTQGKHQRQPHADHAFLRAQLIQIRRSHTKRSFNIQTKCRQAANAHLNSFTHPPAIIDTNAYKDTAPTFSPLLLIFRPSHA